MNPLLTPLRIGSDLLLRCWVPSDADLLQLALERSRDDLEEWTPWVLEGASDVARLHERLAGYRADFEQESDLLYAIMDPKGKEVFGGIGLYRRVGKGGLEIGYWVRTDQTRLGIATRASAELTRVAFLLQGTQRVEIRCRKDNLASVRIPQKLGYRLRETVSGSPERPGATEIWEIDRAQYANGFPGQAAR